ncbi:hypothetical protein ACFVWY_15010 [Streptomyces sp. NPDC058195]|uniref:hypothetical protein n=1 Tax=Streptomyces sp. NPDC058195 TaxID=3346375 RepID=UPI0036E5CAD2
MTTADGPSGADGWVAADRRDTGSAVRVGPARTRRRPRGPGRLLPLGGPADGAWITERAAVAVLRSAVTGPDPGPVLGAVRISAAGPEATPGAAPGALRIEAAMAAVAGRPLPESAGALRAALLAAADQRLGLVIGAVDLRVTDLLDAAPDTPAPVTDPEVHGVRAQGALEEAAAGAWGVVTLTRTPGHTARRGLEGARIELAADADHRALDVARAVRGAVAAVTGAPPVAVLVTAVVGRD